MIPPFYYSWGDPLGKSAGCSEAIKSPFTCLLFIDGWYCLHVAVRERKKKKRLSICPHAQFLLEMAARTKLLVMLERDFTTSGWLVLFSLKVTIIKCSQLLVSATVFLPGSLACSSRNNLQYKDKKHRVDMNCFIQGRGKCYIFPSNPRVKVKDLCFAARSPCPCPR